MSNTTRSRHRPLGNVQRRERDDALVAIQNVLKHLKRNERATRDLFEKRLTGEGVKERGVLIHMTNSDAREAALIAIALLQSMSDETGPLDDSILR